MNSNSLVIGVAGVAGAGKDTVAMHLSQNHSFSRLAFADPLKEVCSALYGIPLAKFHDRSEKEVVDPYWNKSPREIAQWVGTELIRQNLSQDHWIKRMEYELQQKPKNRICVSDVRFQNEIEYLTQKPNGFIIHLIRPGIGPINSHVSDQIDKLVYDPQWTYQVINDGSISDLLSRINEVMEMITERVAAAISSDSGSFINSSV
jgi:hypothetical protein